MNKNYTDKSKKKSQKHKITQTWTNGKYNNKNIQNMNKIIKASNFTVFILKLGASVGNNLSIFFTNIKGPWASLLSCAFVLAVATSVHL